MQGKSSWPPVTRPRPGPFGFRGDGVFTCSITSSCMVHDVQMEGGRQWKRPRTRAKELQKRGMEKSRAKRAACNNYGSWRNAGASHMNQAIPISTLTQMGLVSLLHQHRRLKCNS